MNLRNGGRPQGVLKRIAHRPTDRQAMIETAELEVVPNRGPVTENRKPGKREITLLSAESWAEACRELGVELPWHTRRANLLIEGIELSTTIGKTLSIGPIRIQVHGETKPCGLMDQQHNGLRTALIPNFRGGVYGQILIGGTIRVDDAVVLLG